MHWTYAHCDMPWFLGSDWTVILCYTACRKLVWQHAISCTHNTWHQSEIACKLLSFQQMASVCLHRKSCLALLLYAGAIRVLPSVLQTRLSFEASTHDGCQWLCVWEENSAFCIAWDLVFAGQCRDIDMMPVWSPSHRVKSRVVWPALGFQLAMYRLL